MAMTPRDAVRASKTVISDTGWKTGAIPPRHAPIFKKSKAALPNWQWRSLELVGTNRMICLIEASPAYGKWKAWLIDSPEGGDAAVVMRLEDQPGKSGLHIHADCDGGNLTGPQSINLPQRIPSHGKRHRRGPVWTTHSFVAVAAKTFRIRLEAETPDLFDEC